MSNKNLKRIIIAVILIITALSLLQWYGETNCTKQTITIDGKDYTTCAEMLEDRAEK